jgi:hypothetical protein
MRRQRTTPASSRKFSPGTGGPAKRPGKLISKSGFKAGLVSLARQRDDLQLIDAAAVADDLPQVGRVR